MFGKDLSLFQKGGRLKKNLLFVLLCSQLFNNYWGMLFKILHKLLVCYYKVTYYMYAGCPKGKKIDDQYQC